MKTEARFLIAVVLMLIVLPTLLVGRRSFCHHLCWMAPFMILGRKLRNLLNTPALRLTLLVGIRRYH